MIFFMVLWLFMWRWWDEWPKAFHRFDPLILCSKKFTKFMNKLEIMPVFKSENCSYFIRKSCLFLVNKCSYLHDFLRALIIWSNVGHSCERMLITVENIFHVFTAWIDALLTISMSIIHLLTKSPNEMPGTPKDISKLISSVSLSPDQGSNYFAAQMISAYIFYASEPGSHRYMSSIITLKLQQPWLLSMMLISSSLMFRQYRIDFSFRFHLYISQ